MASKKDRDKKRAKVASAKKRAEQHDSGGITCLTMPSDTSLFSFKKEGTYRVDIIPFLATAENSAVKKGWVEEGQLYYEHTYYNHRGIGANNESYVCSARTFGKPCPICDHRKKLMSDPNSDEELIKNLAPKERQLFNVFVHGEADKGVQLLEIAHFNFGKQLDAMIRGSDEDDGYDTFHDPDNGKTLKLGVIEEPAGKGSTYRKVTTIEFKPREPLDEDLLNAAAVLEELPKEMDYDALKKIFLMTEDNGKDEEDDEKPTRNGKVKPKSRKVEEDDDEEPEEEEAARVFEIGDRVEHEDHGECEVVHVSKDGSSLRIKDEDGKIHRPIAPDELTLMSSDEEDEPEEEEEEDPTPKKRSGAGKPKSKKTSTEDDDEEPEEEDEPEEEEEDEEPAPKKGKGKKAPVEDEDEDEPIDEDDFDFGDDDEEPEEEDEDEPPAKKGRGRPKGSKARR